ncbi:MAG: hypothetical protein COA79_03820 [Planctomycetota bacterium]|nr:MAG: hypothetical protein COA79_03820 [Planctomycetota bacterium]
MKFYLFFIIISTFTINILHAQSKSKTKVLTNSFRILNFNDNLLLGSPYLFFERDKVEKYDGDDLGETYFSSFQFQKTLIKFESLLSIKYTTRLWTNRIDSNELNYIDITSVHLNYQRLPYISNGFKNHFYWGIELGIELRTQIESLSFASYQQDIVHQIKNNNPTYINTPYKRYAGLFEFKIGRENQIGEKWIANISLSSQIKAGNHQIRNESAFATYIEIHYGKEIKSINHLDISSKWELKLIYLNFKIDLESEQSMKVGSKVFRNIPLGNCNAQIGIGLFFPFIINENEYAEKFPKDNLKKELNFTVNIVINF